LLSGGYWGDLNVLSRLVSCTDTLSQCFKTELDSSIG
jgi:hypothetical protein